MDRFTGLIGIVVLLSIALAMSSDRRRIPWRVVAGGIALQFALGWLMLAWAPAVDAVTWLAQLVTQIISAADAGSEFIFGELAKTMDPWGFVFAFRVLTVIIFFASLMAILYYMGIMQRIVAALAFVLRGTLGVTGTEALAVSANVFVGQTEAPLCIKPFISKMTQSQLMTLMTGGFATIAGSVLAAYVTYLGGDDPVERVLFAKHLITASVMSAPAAFVTAKIIVPETGTPVDEGLHQVKVDDSTRNVLDAAAAGATDGLRLALNVAAMLIAFVALLRLANMPLAWASHLHVVEQFRNEGAPPLSLQFILGWAFKPLAWTMGVPWKDCRMFGSLLGTKLIATEFVAYVDLANAMHAQTPQIGDRAAQIAAYALCGFANFPSIAIQIGGLTALAPDRRSDFASLGLRAMIGGALASWMTACIAGIFI